MSDENDPQTGQARDPMTVAQQAMRAPLPRRFYERAERGGGDGDHQVLLDGRPARTPGRNPLSLPTARAADLLVAEYAGQAEVIDPRRMPVTRLVNTAIDGVAADPQAVLEDILRFAGTDLLCYRADSPQTLVERQSEQWDPVLDWARSTLGARFFLAEGIVHVTQPRETIATLGIHLKARATPLELAALHVMTSLTGSALLALAVEDGMLSGEEAWQAAHVDEDWNIAQWGEDAEASSRREARRTEMVAAVDLVKALKS